MESKVFVVQRWLVLEKKLDCFSKMVKCIAVIASSWVDVGDVESVENSWWSYH